jgi:DNA-binding MarR family transcriptional regulator
LYTERRFTIIFVALFTIAIFMTTLSAVVYFTHFGAKPQPLPIGSSNQSLSEWQTLLVLALRTLPVPFSIGTWIALAGVIVFWKGRTRSVWLRLGFDQDVFKLFIKMRGSSTRLQILKGISGTAKDRLQLAKELGIQWKAVDRHVRLLEKYGFAEEKATQGTAKFYELTPLGEKLLNLLLEKEEENPSVKAFSG